MDIVISGAGEVGTYLARMLSNEKHNIILIDKDEEKLKVLNSHIDILTLHGSSSSIDDLTAAKVSKSDLFIAVTSSEEVNITSCILSKKLGAKKTIARIDNSEYLAKDNKELFMSLGIDSLIYPEKLAAEETVASLKLSGARQLYEFSDGKLMLFAIKLRDNAPVLGLTLAEAIKTANNYEYRAVAITRDGKTIIPRGDYVFKSGDLVHIVSNPSSTKELMKNAGKKQHQIKNIMILGGSRIGVKSALKLENNNNIKIIEIDKLKCVQMADVLENTLVINGDGRDMDLLTEEGIANMDAFVAVTGNSETNILACLLAKKMGVKRTVAEIENIDYLDLADNVSIGSMINKKLIAASYIYRFTMAANVNHFKVLTSTDAEIIELTAKPNSKITKGMIKDINFPKDANIGGVIRGKESIIASGTTQIEPNDKVVVFTLPSAIRKIEKLFS